MRRNTLGGSGGRATAAAVERRAVEQLKWVRYVPEMLESRGEREETDGGKGRRERESGVGRVHGPLHGFMARRPVRCSRRVLRRLAPLGPVYRCRDPVMKQDRGRAGRLRSSCSEETTHGRHIKAVRGRVIYAATARWSPYYNRVVLADPCSERPCRWFDFQSCLLHCCAGSEQRAPLFTY